MIYKIKNILQKIFRGYSDDEVYDLDRTFVKFILPRLKRYKELSLGGHPFYLTEKAWLKMLDDMIEGFESMADKEGLYFRREEKEKHAIELFCTNLRRLWI